MPRAMIGIGLSIDGRTDKMHYTIDIDIQLTEDRYEGLCPGSSRWDRATAFAVTEIKFTGR